MKAGDIVRVRVVEVDVARNRIGLTMRKDGGVPQPREQKPNPRDAKQVAKYANAKPAGRPESGSLGAALLDALQRRASRADADFSGVSLSAGAESMTAVASSAGLKRGSAGNRGLLPRPRAGPPVLAPHRAGWPPEACLVEQGIVIDGTIVAIGAKEDVGGPAQFVTSGMASESWLHSRML